MHFFALNCVLLFKWAWRFLSSQVALWVKVAKAIHEEKALIGYSLPTGSSFIWIDILKVTSPLFDKGLYLFHFCKRNVGDGALTLFWEDVWIGDSSLKSQFP